MKMHSTGFGRRMVLGSLAGWALAAVLGGATARAAFDFNPTGGGASGALTINGFDPLPGNALGRAATGAIANAVTTGGGDVAGNQFLLYYQAALGSLLPGTQNPADLNKTFQITFTGVVREYVSSVVGGTAIFGVSADQTGSFLRMYENNAVTYNDLNGTGFTDGKLILSASPLVASSAGNFTNIGPIGALDQHNLNDWAGTTTVGGFGGSVLNFKVDSGDSTYFVTPPPDVLKLAFSSTQNLPFTGVDPSRNFFNGYATNVGTINGLSGPDVLFQADANVSVVPEPSSLCLTALGVGGILVSALYRRKMTV